MKTKSGFAAFAKNKLPLNHNKPWAPPPKTKENTDPSLGKLLPHGFRVGERVYYNSYHLNKVYGTVVDHSAYFAPQSNSVWAHWEGRSEYSYMPLAAVFRAKGNSE